MELVSRKHRSCQRYVRSLKFMHEMTRTEKTANLLAVALPFVAAIAAIPLLWNQLVSATDLAIMVGDVPDHRLRDHDRLPPAAHAPGLRDGRAAALRVRDHGIDGRPGLGHRLGGGSPQAPRLRRRGRGPALAARPRQRRGRRAQGPVARTRRLAPGRARARGLVPLCPRADGRPRDAQDQPRLPGPGRPDPRDPVRRGVAAHRHRSPAP